MRRLNLYLTERSKKKESFQKKKKGFKIEF